MNTKFHDSHGFATNARAAWYRRDVTAPGVTVVLVAGRRPWETGQIVHAVTDDFGDLVAVPYP